MFDVEHPQIALFRNKKYKNESIKINYSITKQYYDNTLNEFCQRKTKA
jgi:hypothetical protein